MRASVFRTGPVRDDRPFLDALARYYFYKARGSYVLHLLAGDANKSRFHFISSGLGSNVLMTDRVAMASFSALYLGPHRPPEALYSRLGWWNMASP